MGACSGSFSPDGGEDAGIEGDAARAPSDAQPPPDARADVPDGGGGLASCDQGWVSVSRFATPTHAARPRLLSMAAQGDRVAITYWTADEGLSDGRTYMVIAGPDGRVVRAAFEVSPNSRVIAWEDGFLRAGSTGVQRHERHGVALGPEVAVADHFELVDALEGRACGVVYEATPAWTAVARVACLRPEGPGWTLEPTEITETGDFERISYALGPDRVLVLRDGGYHAGYDAWATLFVTGEDGALTETSFMLPGVQAADARWDPAAGAFRVLLGYDADDRPDGFEFRPRVARIEGTEVIEEPPLDDHPDYEAAPFGYGLTGALAIGMASYAVVYTSPTVPDAIQLDVVRGDAQEHVGGATLGASSAGRSLLLAPFGDRYLVAQVREDGDAAELVVRCDVAQ